MQLAAFDELGLGQVLKADVAGHGEVGAVELHHQSGCEDGVIFLAHDLGERPDVVFVAGVPGVGLEGRDEARGSGVHEAFGHAMALHGPGHVGDVGVQRSPALHRDGADAGGPAEGLRAGHPGHLGAELGIGLQVQGHAPLVGPAEAVQPVHHVGGVADLGGLAVGRDVDPGLHLPAHHFVHRFGDGAVVGLRIGDLAAVLLQQRLDQRLAAGQAAHVGGQDAVGGGLHGLYS